MKNGVTEAVDFFVFTMAELAILFMGISFIVSLVQHYLPAQRVQQMLQGHRGYGLAVALGSITPFCSCSTLPMTVGLLKARADFGPAMTFLFTSPLFNPFLIALFWVSFGPKITLIYGFFVVLLAIVSGMALQYFKFDRYIRAEIIESHVDQEAGCENPSRNAAIPVPWKQLGKDAWRQFRTFVPYMVLGVGVGAVLHGFVPKALFANLSQESSVWLIPFAAIFGVFLYVRAATMVPIATSLIAKGMSVGAVMSLTIAGAGASLPEMIMMKRMFHWPLLLAFIFLVFATACVTGFVIEWV